MTLDLSAERALIEEANRAKMLNGVEALVAIHPLIFRLVDSNEKLMAALQAALYCSWCEGKEDCTACANSRERVADVLEAALRRERAKGKR